MGSAFERCAGSRIAAALSVVAALAGCESATETPDAPASAWREGPALPRRVAGAGVAAFVQQIVVAGGGEDAMHPTAQVDAFDVFEQMWRAFPDAPVAWRDPNVAASGAMLYLAGGIEVGAGGAVARGDAFVFDQLTAGWRTIAALAPGDARGASGVVTATGRVYLLGGVTPSGPVATCLEYDVALDQWIRLPDLPAPRAHPAAMRMFDGTLIVAGGFDSVDDAQPRSEVWALPPPGSVQRAWQSRPGLHAIAGAARGGCAYGVVLGQLVCAGGDGGASASTAVEAYDATLDEWHARESLPVERVRAQGAAIGGQLYVPGGAATRDGPASDTLYIYAPLDTATR